ncbi:MAG: metalloregulator ArsR/SmtB family transcription factor [Myxococcota bacterium]|nr:metalloregulator ArsR/SmtB family transcription factor [Myxococcota bacterium]
MDARHFKDAAYAHLAEVGKAIASPARLEILELLAQAPRTVEVLAGEVAQSVANTSHHLQVLKRAQLVTHRRDGQYVAYALAGDDVAGLLTQLHAVAAAHVAALEALTRDYFEDPAGLEPLDVTTLLARLRADEAVLVDVRPEHEFAAGHVPGAISLPLTALKQRVAELPRDRTVVAYCRGPYCTFSAEATRRLRALGFDARRTHASVHSLTRALRKRPARETSADFDAGSGTSSPTTSPASSSSVRATSSQTASKRAAAPRPSASATRNAGVAKAASKRRTKTAAPVETVARRPTKERS